MRWQGGRRSTNVDDRRGLGGGAAAGGGIGAVVIGVIFFLLTGDPSAIPTPGAAGPSAESRTPTAAEDSLAEFVRVVLAHTEDTWNERFAAEGASYREPTLVLFTGAVTSACGSASSAVGPFYCPPDERVYIDLGFYDQLKRDLGAPGDFAQAYVIAHEVGHHVQTLTGTSEQVRAQARGAPTTESNRLSVLQELQADCYAGIFAHDAQRKGVLEPGDIDEALRAAAAIGDDNLQRRGQGQVVPETFTHGTSAQRSAWFRRGFETGDPTACDTFSHPSP
jgi:uncharacterized protein